MPPRAEPGHTRRRRRAAARGLAGGLACGLACLVAACGPSAHGPGGRDGRAGGGPAPPTAAEAASRSAAGALGAARAFLDAFAARRYGAQWAELAPAARADWPSAAARSAMLAAKFALPAARVVQVSLGRPVPHVTWASHEDPLRSAVGWAVPVAVRFAEPLALRPQGVSALYRSLELVVVPGAGGGAWRVAGEGPASLDAPILVPPRVPDRTTRVPILMYHRVGPYPTRAEWSSAYGYELEMGLTVPPSQFAAEMAVLHRSQASAISLARLADALLYGLPLPPHPVAITFDDGRQSPFRYAVPLLRREGFTATFFMPGGFVGAINGPQHYLTARELGALNGWGFWVEDHTLYDNLALWGLSPSQVGALAGASAVRIERHTGWPIQFIAYSGLWPYPSAQEVGPQETQLFAELAHLGYVGGAVDAPGGGISETTSGLWQLPRLRVSPGETTAGFAAALRAG